MPPLVGVVVAAVEQFAAPQPVPAEIGAIVKWLGW